MFIDLRPASKTTAEVKNKVWFKCLDAFKEVSRDWTINAEKVDAVMCFTGRETHEEDVAGAEDANDEELDEADSCLASSFTFIHSWGVCSRCRVVGLRFVCGLHL